MNFGDTGNCTEDAKASAVFTTNAASASNLVGAFAAGTGSVFYSSSVSSSVSVLLGGAVSSGWQPSGQGVGEFVGYLGVEKQTFYACDVQQMAGSNLQVFSLEYSMDGHNYIKINDFSFSSVVIGTITTFRFKPVYALSIRLVVQQGIPNIRL
jgi:hypothetical protein